MAFGPGMISFICILILSHIVTIQGKELASSLLLAAVGFNPIAARRSTTFNSASYTSFSEMANSWFSTGTRSATWLFSLADLQAVGITIIPTHSIYEHLCLDGSKLKVFIVSGGSGNMLLSYRENVLARCAVYKFEDAWNDC
jgi:hypothetical protein